MKAKAPNRFKELGSVAQRVAGRGAGTFGRLAILDRVWERLYGHRARHWKLEGVQGATVYVRVTSPAAGQDLRLQAAGMMRELNKHFERPWIKILKTIQ